jgi:hypothetical protein
VKVIVQEGRGVVQGLGHLTQQHLTSHRQILMMIIIMVHDEVVVMTTTSMMTVMDDYLLMLIMVMMGHQHHSDHEDSVDHAAQEEDYRGGEELPHQGAALAHARHHVQDGVSQRLAPPLLRRRQVVHL